MNLLYLTFLTTATACTGISFRGGGSFGAVEVGMLATLLERGDVPASVDILTGISAGGLNAGFLASNMETGASLEESVGTLGSLYASLNNLDVYTYHPLKSFTSWSIYQTTPLNTTISNTLAKMPPKGGAVPRTLIGTSDLRTGLLEVVDYNGLTDLAEKVAALMATSAIPMVFPPIRWNGTLYVDGGLVSNEILFQAVEYLGCSEPTLWFFEPSDGISVISEIGTFGTYLHRVLSMAFSGFDSQLQKLLVNPREGCQGGAKAVTLNVCHPNDTGIAELAGYSILEFGNGKTLYSIGRDTVVCDPWLLCV